MLQVTLQLALESLPLVALATAPTETALTPSGPVLPDNTNHISLIPCAHFKTAPVRMC